jgi:hypothetical protein
VHEIAYLAFWIFTDYALQRQMNESLHFDDFERMPGSRALSLQSDKQRSPQHVTD